MDAAFSDSKSWEKNRKFDVEKQQHSETRLYVILGGGAVISGPERSGDSFG